MTVTLVQIGYSPWSEKARWALDHHRIAYRKVDYLPMVAEPLLRFRLGKLTGPVTVPVLIDRDQIFTDSYTIARHADAVGRGALLFPPDSIDTIARFDENSNRLLEAGRARTTARTLESEAALREALPPPLRRLGPLGLPIAKLGARYLQKKYATDAATLEAHRETMERELERLRESLGSRDHLVGDGFSYADICMAVSLQFVAPIAAAGRLGKATRATWSEPDLAAAFDDVVSWRDRTYELHR